MTLVRFRPAPYHAFAAMLAQDADARTQRKLLGPEGFAKLQLLTPGSLSWGFWRGETCVACAGLFCLSSRSGRPQSLEELRYEAWFTCLPELARDLRSFVRLAQLTLSELPQDAIIEARVSPGWLPGEKLAALLGFKRGGQPDLWERRA